MPRRDFHDLMEKAIFGKLTGMNQIMDSPSKDLHGQHRVLFHDPLQIMLLSIVKGGDIIENFKAGIIHSILDESISEGTRGLRKYVKQSKK